MGLRGWVGWVLRGGECESEKGTDAAVRVLCVCVTLVPFILFHPFAEAVCRGFNTQRRVPALSEISLP